jgi:hypothetical protein
MTPALCRHRDEVGIFAHGLLDAAPAVVPHDVQHRRETLVHADGRHVPPDRGRHPLDEVGVERRSPGDGRGVDRGAEGREPCQALLVDQRGDAEAGGVEDDPLLPHQLLGAGDGGDRGAAEDPGEVAEPVPARLFERQRPPRREHVLHRRHGAVGVAARGRLLAGVDLGVRQPASDPPAAELGHLLLEGHLLEEQLHTVGRRKRRVLPTGRHLGRYRGRVLCRHQASFDKFIGGFETFRCGSKNRFSSVDHAS